MSVAAITRFDLTRVMRVISGNVRQISRSNEARADELQKPSKLPIKFACVKAIVVVLALPYCNRRGGWDCFQPTRISSLGEMKSLFSTAAVRRCLTGTFD